MRTLLFGGLAAIHLWGCNDLGFLRSATGNTRVDSFFGKEVRPGIVMLTGTDLRPFQTSFPLPELADPYVTQLGHQFIISGTAQYHLKFRSLDEIRKGGPYQVQWNEYVDAKGGPLAQDRRNAHSWDMKPAPWPAQPQPRLRLWDASRDKDPPRVTWYGGRMRPRPSAAMAHWPGDNYSRDVFAYVERKPGLWFSTEDSIFSLRGYWPRPTGNYLGHRYGHQIVMVPKLEDGTRSAVPAIFYEEVTEVRSDGSPLITRIFMDELATPLQARGRPAELLSPINPATGRPFPSTIREDGSALVEGPLYFRFQFNDEEWEGIAFSSGSFYGNYSANFASRRVADGLAGKPYLPDLIEGAGDLRNAGAELGTLLNLAGGPGRPAVIVGSDGKALTDSEGRLQILVHGYRKDILPDNDYSRFPEKYRLDQMFRVILYAPLLVEAGPGGIPRFQIGLPPASNAAQQVRTLPI